MAPRSSGRYERSARASTGCRWRSNSRRRAHERWPPAQIAERLDQRFRLLTVGGRTSIERHRTLQATVSWSYDLLDEADKAVFMRLSTMAGSFDLGAAEAVAAGGTVGDWEVLDALGRLVDSMVVGVEGGHELRYRLLETLRQFGADRLAEAPDAEEVQVRYAHYWRDRAIALGQAMGGGDQATLLASVEADIDNYRRAFAHLLTLGQVDEAARGILALDTYWEIRRPREGLRWHEQLLTHPELEPRRRLRALAQAAQTAGALGDTYRAERHATQAIDAARAIGTDPPWQAVYALMYIAALRHEPDSFQHWWHEASRVAIASGREYPQLIMDTVRFNETETPDPVEAVGQLESLRSRSLAHGDPLLITTSACALCMVHARLGDSKRARQAAELALDQGEAAGPVAWSGGLTTVAAAEALVGDPARAVSALQRALPLARDEGITLQLINGALIAASLAVHSGDHASAATLLGGALHHAEPLGVVGSQLIYLCRVGAEHALQCDEGDLSTARATGAAMTIEDLTNYTLATLTESIPAPDCEASQAPRDPLQ
jgi:hypothetical protein